MKVYLNVGRQIVPVFFAGTGVRVYWRAGCVLGEEGEEIIVPGIIERSERKGNTSSRHERIRYI